ncbi:MAG: TonB-dependent receptor, partial [Roseateles sp.]
MDVAQPQTPVALEAVVVTGARRFGAGTHAPVAAGQYNLRVQDWTTAAMPAANPLLFTRNLPGVTVTSADAYGLDVSDAFIFVRGFFNNELAYSFEGVPLNDGSLGSVTGNAVLSVGVPDQIGSVKVAPGSARVSTFSSTAGGGELLYGLVDLTPTPKLSGTVGRGSYNTQLYSLSWQSGRIGELGPKLLLGWQQLSKDKYTGRGTQSFERANAKVVQDLPWGDVSLFVSAARARVWGYNNTSFDMLGKLGWSGTDIFYPDYATAYRIASPENASARCGAYTCGEFAIQSPYDTGQATNDLLGNLVHRFKLSPASAGKFMVYGASNRSDIEIADVTVASQTGAPFSSQVWQPRSHRRGATLELSYKTDRHDSSIGLWVERGVGRSSINWYNQPVLGAGEPLKAVGPYTTYGPAFKTANLSQWNTSSTQFYVRDVIELSDEVSLDVGFKAVRFVTSGGGIGTDRAPNGSLTVDDPFLPHLALEWRPSAGSLMFIDAGASTVAYRIAPRDNIGPVNSAWSATDQATFDEAVKGLKAEQSWNLTLGGYQRLGATKLNADIYIGWVRNRLLNGVSGPQIAPVRSVGIVPRSHVVGADLTISIDPLPWLTLSQSWSVSRFRYDSALQVPGNPVDLRGKSQPGYPGQSFVTQASVHLGGFEAGLASTLFNRQPFTYSNDRYLPSQWTVN